MDVISKALALGALLVFLVLVTIQMVQGWRTGVCTVFRAEPFPRESMPILYWMCMVAHLLIAGLIATLLIAGAGMI